MEKNEIFEGKKRGPDEQLEQITQTTQTTEQKPHKKTRSEKKWGTKKRNKAQNSENPSNPSNQSNQSNPSNNTETNQTKKSFDHLSKLKSQKFEQYYKTQLAPYFPSDKNEFTSQFSLFLDKLKEKLPCVFRLNTANPFWQQLREIITAEDLVKDLLSGEDHGIKITPRYLTNSKYWRDIIFNINIPRMELKKNHSLAKFAKLIQNSVDSGLMSRQEAVSMLPPILMNTGKGEKIFDMCAAPGSKTAQFLETFYRDYDFLSKSAYIEDTGCVIANDNSHNRAFMMTHQLKRLNTAGMIVISHDAQVFPFLYGSDGNNIEDKSNSTSRRVLFDKILADVPCSSDAVLRKLPHKWKNWSPKEGFSLHKLQLTIAKRGVSMLKPGGVIVYSTCSLNPIENEAVVSELMKTSNDELEILDMFEMFTGGEGVNSINCRPGLTSWKVFVDNPNYIKKSENLTENSSENINTENSTNTETNPSMLEINSFESETLKSINKKGLVEASCFPPDYETAYNKYKLQNCIRLFPHDSDTSGFFITVIRKKETAFVKDKIRNDSEFNKKTSTSNTQNSNENLKEETGIYFADNLATDGVNWLKTYYGLNNFPFDQLTTQSKILFKKFNFVSKGVADILRNDTRNQLKLINVGVKLFAISKKKNEENYKDPLYCRYRICQDGLFYIIPFLTKRVVFCNLEAFLAILKSEDGVLMPFEGDKNIEAQVKRMSFGSCVIIYVKENPRSENTFEEEYYAKYLKENYVDAFTGNISGPGEIRRIVKMVNKDHMHTFNLKYS